MACQKAFLNTFDNSVSDIADAGLLSDDNYIDDNVDMDTKAKSNLDENMTSKNDDDLCKNNPVTNIKELFQQVWNQTSCERLTKKVLKQTCRFF